MSVTETDPRPNELNRAESWPKSRLSRNRPSWPEQIRGLCLVLCATACLLLIAVQAILSFDPNRNLWDYGSLYASAAKANLHTNPYGDDPLVFRVRDFDHFGPETPLQGRNVAAINLNPPVLLYPFRLLARLPPRDSFHAWTAVSVALFLASILLVLDMYPVRNLRIRLLWILSLAGLWYTFQAGQIYTLLLFATALAWWCLRKQKYIAAGIAIGVICAIKPPFLIWPVLLIAGRSKKAGFAAIAAALGFSAIPLGLQGPLIYQQWIAACRNFNGYELEGNSSLLAMFSRAGIPGVGLVFTILMLLAALVWIFVTKPDPLFTSEIAILASIFAGPISWIGYTILLVPALYGKSMNTLTRIACVLLCIPIWVVLPRPADSRFSYIFLTAPNFYPLTLIAISVISVALKHSTAVADTAAIPKPLDVGRRTTPQLNPQP